MQLPAVTDGAVQPAGNGAMRQGLAIGAASDGQETLIIDDCRFSDDSQFLHQRIEID